MIMGAWFGWAIKGVVKDDDSEAGCFKDIIRRSILRPLSSAGFNQALYGSVANQGIMGSPLKRSLRIEFRSCTILIY